MKNEIFAKVIMESHVPASRWTGKSRTERNAEILMALARGIDELEKADDAEMKRRERAIEALTAGAQALRGELKENAGKGWTDQEEERLMEALWAGMSLAEMARLLGRSERAVWMKLEKIRPGKIAEESRRTAVQSAWNRLMREGEAE